MLKKIYLAGTVTATNYRDHVHNAWGNTFELVDPIKRNDPEFANRGTSLDKVIAGEYFIDDDFASTIVTEDKEMIANSDYVVAYIETPTFGTVMEVMFSYILSKPVFVIAPLNIQKDVWLRIHTTMFFTEIDECFETISRFRKLIRVY